MIALMDTVLQEPVVILARNERELDEVYRKRPEHHRIAQVQNLGDVDEVSDYLKNIAK